MEQITRSQNLFIDSSVGHSSGSKGDDYLVNLQDFGVNAGEGEFIRLTLDNFSMAKVFTDVNDTNNHFRLRYTADGTTYKTRTDTSDTHSDFTLTKRNNKTIFDLATDFQTQFIAGLNLLDHELGTLTPGAVTPASITALSDNIISFTVNYSGTQVTAGEIKIQAFSDISDSYTLIGGDRLEGNKTDSVESSVDISMPNDSQVITVTCRYPAQRMTMPYVYIRTPGVLNTNIETKGLKDSRNNRGDVFHSDILGRAVVDTSEWVQYTAQTGREFFLDIQQKQLNFLRLRLTDAKERPIGRNTTAAASNTATGTGTEQSTKGNLSFSAVLRIDIIKKKHIEHLETNHYKPPIPARFSNGITLQQRFGEDTFGKKPHL